MASIAPACPPVLPARPSLTRATPALLLAAFLLRWPHLGDPAYMIDEQFYLVTGSRMLHGALPYVDIWDRKPIGLFLIYMGAAAFGSGAILAYQLMALASAGATAAVIARIARPIAGAAGAITAGMLYLLWLELHEGGGGQSPVFYNLPMAIAAWAVLRASDATDRRRFTGHGFIAMACAGIAIQIKYTAVCESVFFGAVLSWWCWRRLPRLAAVRTVLLLAATALAPTAIAFGSYAAIGHGREFWFANFLSIFLRGPTTGGRIPDRVWAISVLLTPFAICIGASWLMLRARGDAIAMRTMRFMLGWCAAALAGVFAVGALYMHYLLPAFVPATCAAAPVLGRRTIGPALALFTALLPLSMIHYPDVARTARHRAEIAALTALIPPRVDTGCLQIFDGPSILFWTTHACALTRFAFPDHLAAANEQDAVGVDTLATMAAIMRRHPLAVTIGQPDPTLVNRRTYRLLRTILPREYRLAGKVVYNDQPVEVWTWRGADPALAPLSR